MIILTDVFGQSPRLPGRVQMRVQIRIPEDEPDDGDDGPDVCTFAPGLHQNFGKSANEENRHSRENSDIGDICTKICTDQNSTLHQLPGTESMPAGAGESAFRVCETRSGANVLDISKIIGQILEPAASEGFWRCKIGCKRVQRCKRSSRSTPPFAPARTRRQRTSLATPTVASRCRRCGGAGALPLLRLFCIGKAAFKGATAPGGAGTQ